MKENTNVEVIETENEGTEKVGFLTKMKEKCNKENAKKVGKGLIIGAVGLVGGYFIGKNHNTEDSYEEESYDDEPTYSSDEDTEE